MTKPSRPDGRAPRELRPVTIETGAVEHAEGSCLITQGRTRVLVTATVEEKVPPFLRDTGEGWVTAEYGMLPRATLERSPREAARGKQSGRTLEIQRLIGRALRGVVDRKLLGAADGDARLRRPRRGRRDPLRLGDGRVGRPGARGRRGWRSGGS